MSIAPYALLCLVLPQIWALAIVRLYRHWDGRQRQPRSADGRQPEYMI